MCEAFPKYQDHNSSYAAYKEENQQIVAMLLAYLPPVCAGGY